MEEPDGQQQQQQRRRGRRRIGQRRVQLVLHLRDGLCGGRHRWQRPCVPGRLAGAATSKRHQLVPRLVGFCRPHRQYHRHALRRHGWILR